MLIVLDEATAFADAENEHQIQLAFEGLTHGKTVLMIAHRLSTIQNADQILVFGDGNIIERGNHDELLKKNEFRWIQIGTKYRISKKSFDGWLDKL